MARLVILLCLFNYRPVVLEVRPNAVTTGDIIMKAQKSIEKNEADALSFHLQGVAEGKWPLSPRYNK